MRQKNNQTNPKITGEMEGESQPAELMSSARSSNKLCPKSVAHSTQILVTK